MSALRQWPGRSALFVLTFTLSLADARARDWIHWRGPEETGQSREKNLPDSFDPAQGAKGNVIWKQPFGGRSSPLILNGRAYIMHGVGQGVQEGEEVMCLDTKTGAPLATYKLNVFHTDIVSVRLGWCTLTADPATETIYVHSTAGLVFAFDKNLKVLWQRSLTEEFGRVSGYGGRIVSPIFDSGLVIVGMINSSWGDQARGGNRFVAFDGKTGQIAWWAESPYPIKGTYYSNPVIAVINGVRLLITGGGDGYLHAFNVRTGERVWSYLFSAGVVNPSPVVDGNLIYCAHGEENPEGGNIGRVICVDGSQVDSKTKAPKKVWDTYQRKYKANRNQALATRFGLASPALADGKLYMADDGGDLFCFDAKTGEYHWKYKYATEVRGAPLVADGKIYVFDVKARLMILTLDEKDLKNKPDEALTFEYRFRAAAGLSETNGTPIAVNNRIYFNTRNEMYCLGVPSAKDECGKYKVPAAETPFDPNAAAANVRIFPADLEAKAGTKASFKVIGLDANGREVMGKNAAAAWELPLPPKTPAGAQPPALNGKVEGPGSEATVALAPLPSQQGYIDVKVGDRAARARVRVAAGITYVQDFEKIPVGAPPSGWVNATGKYVVAEQKTGDKTNKVLSKVNNDSRPPIARANAYITLPTAHDYTIQADVMGTLVAEQAPDMGVVAQRYTLILDGKTDPQGKREVRLVSWEARPRVNVAAPINWKPGTWYTAKLSVRVKDNTALVLAKVWERDQPEPEKWTLEFEDSNPNREGAAALYGYVSNIKDPMPGSEIFYDNVRITPNASANAQANPKK